MLFGSVATGQADERSDIDLAVAGLEPHRHFLASAEAVDAAGHEVDLVCIEDAAPSLLDHGSRGSRQGDSRYDDAPRRHAAQPALGSMTRPTKRMAPVWTSRIR